jgi:hypothetical protein
MVFDGEEVSRAVRLWTHGYDLYTPSRNLVFHDYKNALKQNAWVQRGAAREGGGPSEGGAAATEEEMRAMGIERFGQLWRTGGRDGADIPPEFQLGGARSLAQYAAFSGVSPRGHTMAEGETCADELCWVPPKKVAGHVFDPGAGGTGRWGWDAVGARVASLAGDAEAAVAAADVRVGAAWDAATAARAVKQTCMQFATDADCCQGADDRQGLESPCVPMTRWNNKCEPFRWVLDNFDSYPGLSKATIGECKSFTQRDLNAAKFLVSE